jgi:beta-glucosidase
MKELFPTVTDIVVSEFGFAEPLEDEQTSLPAILWDLRRADYYQGFLDNILAARVEDGGLSLSSTLDLLILMSFVGVGITDVFR